MAIGIRKIILKEKQMTKFCMYGYLKNLKLFEPFLLIFLLNNGISLLQIGFLYSIREITIFIWEIPSGVLADAYGKKWELMTCFLFYIISFALFFMGDRFNVFVVAIIFFGLAEAFRSGTHKAMIYTWLDKNDWYKERTFVYARTRSFSLWGGATAGLLGALILFIAPSSKYVFAATTIPYVMDFILIATYPNYMNKRKDKNGSLWLLKEGVNSFKNVLSIKRLRKTILNSAMYEGMFRTVKDYVQPIMETILLSAILLKGIPREKLTYLVLGVTYFVFYVFSAIGANRSFLCKEKWGSKVSVNRMLILLGILCIFIGLFIENGVVVIILFFLLFIISNIRRPLIVSILGGLIGKEERATIFSIESQMKSIVIIIFAPLIGFLADNLSIQFMFIILGAFIVLINTFVKIPELKK